MPTTIEEFKKAFSGAPHSEWEKMYVSRHKTLTEELVKLEKSPYFSRFAPDLEPAKKELEAAQADAQQGDFIKANEHLDTLTRQVGAMWKKNVAAGDEGAAWKVARGKLVDAMVAADQSHSLLVDAFGKDVPDVAKNCVKTIQSLNANLAGADKLAQTDQAGAVKIVERFTADAQALVTSMQPEAEKVYQQRRKPVQAEIDKLVKHPQADVLKDVHKSAEAQLGEADKLAKAGKYKSALDKLYDANAESTIARVKAEVGKGGAPNKSDFEALAKMPAAKGKNHLDELVSALPDNTPQKVFKMALNVRFGVDVKTYKDKEDVAAGKEVDEATPNKSLQRMYEVMLKVPASHSHADQNPSLKHILHTEKDYSGAAYNRGTKTVKMYLSRGEGSGAFDYSNQLATGTGPQGSMFPDGRVDPYKPVNTGVKTPYFDWATLHEVGHSVDDKSNFMGSHSGAAYGDWVYESRDSIAGVAATKFSWDKAYIMAKLKDPTSNPPVPKAQQEMKDSGKVKVKVDNWCALVVNGEPWFNGGNAKAIQEAVGGRVYQLAYPGDGDWWSYGWGERQKGIHGYQFRAPGEWFAELYAAYYSGKLQDAHPAVKWLKELEAPKSKN